AHALMLSGWSPSETGLVSDRWYDRPSGTLINAAASAEHKLLGSNGEGGSPEQLLVHTVGDALKAAHPRSIVLTASWKKYTAVLNGGHHPDAAFWMDEPTGHFVTSDYYAKSYPVWTGAFTRDDLTLPYFGTTWQGHKLGSGTAPDEAFRTRVRYSPAGNTILLAFAKTLVEQSGIGADE